MAPAPALATVLLALFAVLPRAVVAQEGGALRLAGPEGESRLVPLAFHRGYAAVPADGLGRLGWRARADGDGWILHHLAGGPEIRLHRGSPFFEWDGALLHLTAEPYELGGRLHLPLQVVTDFLPARLPDVYAAADGARTLRVTDASHWSDGGPSGSPGGRGAEGRRMEAAAGRTDGEGGGTGGDAGLAGSRASRSRVVVIDPGHGGRDTGAWGPAGIREKDVALAISKALARELRRYPDLEVHLTREEDVLVPLWQRGELATRTRGDRPGIFVSIHANALPERRSARGFETYFLSEARTEHERRVAANENAPLAIEREDDPGAGDPGLGFILKDLRNDQQHWSAFLAELVQERVAPVHPGPDRGVKQGPFAVITNALMPAVLVEAGFLTNADEAELLADPAFQAEMARALAEAVVDFFRRYPPGEGLDLRPVETEGT